MFSRSNDSMKGKYRALAFIIKKKKKKKTRCPCFI